MKRLAIGLIPAAFVVGVAAEWHAFGWADTRSWVPDILVGWTFVACGLLAWSRRPESRTGILLAATGFAWFAGNFVVALLYLYRGTLFHAIVTFPSGRARGRVVSAAIAGSYLVALIPAVNRSDIANIGLATLLVGVSAWTYRGAVGKERHARRLSLQIAAALALLLAAGAVARLAAPDGRLDASVLLVSELALVVVAIVLLVGLIGAPWERAPVADLVVELGEGSSGTLRDELARAVGDPTLEVGYWLPSTGGYVDSAGRQLVVPEPGGARAVTLVERDGEPLAALVHDPAVLDDPALLDGIGAAARLAATNARLQGDVRRQLSEIEDSRRRILEVGDEERMRLERRLQEGAVSRLHALDTRLGGVPAAGESGAGEHLDRARMQLGAALEELDQLAGGLHPRLLAEQGLEAALEDLATRSPVPVSLTVTAGRVDAEAEASAYFVCSEGLANVAKYASASKVDIRVARAGDRLEVEVADDGVGGADPARGSGLRGLEDRVEALGGVLLVESPAGGGTRLLAVIALGREASRKDQRLVATG